MVCHPWASTWFAVSRTCLSVNNCVLSICVYRRQTAEEREAERQAASRFMLSLHAGAAAGADGEQLDKANLQTTPDPLCLNNASLHALQNLRPWADDNTTQRARQHSDDDNAADDDDDDDDNDDVVDDDVSDVTDERDVNNRCYDWSPASSVAVSSAVLLQPASRPIQLHQPYLTAS